METKTILLHRSQWKPKLFCYLCTSKCHLLLFSRKKESQNRLSDFFL